MAGNLLEFLEPQDFEIGSGLLTLSMMKHQERARDSTRPLSLKGDVEGLILRSRHVVDIEFGSEVAQWQRSPSNSPNPSTSSSISQFTPRRVSIHPFVHADSHAREAIR